MYFTLYKYKVGVSLRGINERLESFNQFESSPLSHALRVGYTMHEFSEPIDHLRKLLDFVCVLQRAV